MSTATVGRPQVRKTTEWKKCSLCLYGNNLLIEIKHDEKNDVYYYTERCPRCVNHFEDFKAISEREAKKYTILDDMP
jgi:C4-type Zn-finger protein